MFQVWKSLLVQSPKYIAFCFLLLSSFSVQANDLDALRESSKGLTRVAKTCMPAVVSIEVYSSMQQGHLVPSQEDPFGFFEDDFFRRFFGVPPEGRRPGRGGRGGPDRGRRQFRENQMQKHEPSARGSGCIVSEDGYIITNNHLVQSVDRIMVLMEDGREFQAELIGQDKGTDLAVLKVQGKDFPYLKFGNSASLEVGQWVMAIGNPFGFQSSVSVGVVSATGRDNLSITDAGDLIQTDVAINPGNSGGPLLNLDAELVGVNTAIISGHGGYMGISFAIPSAVIEHVMQQLIETGSVARGFLGIAPQDLDQDLAASFQVDKSAGVLVADIVKDSPAEKAGIQRGDIIISLNKKPVSSSVSLSKEVRLMSPGTRLDLVLLRAGKNIAVSLDIGIHPSSQGQLGASAKSVGIEVSPLDEQFRSQFSYEEEIGVVVSHVEQGSVASLAGIRPGDLILSVDRKEISTVAEYTEAMNEAVKNKRVLMLVRQGRGKRFISFTLP